MVILPGLAGVWGAAGKLPLHARLSQHGERPEHRHPWDAIEGEGQQVPRASRERDSPARGCVPAKHTLMAGVALAIQKKVNNRNRIVTGADSSPHLLQ